MEPTHLHRGPLEPVAPTAAERLRGALGATLLSVLLGLLIAVLFAVVVAVLAILAVTTLG